MPWNSYFKNNPKKSTGWLVIALVTVTGFEGMVLKPYRDRLANNILTVCMGETRGVQLGDIYTEDQCRELLKNGLIEFEKELQKCITTPMSDKTKAAIVSWSWNVGTNAACKSTLVKKLNVGDMVGACNELIKWNRADGKVLHGLVKRREAERKLCLSGL